MRKIFYDFECFKHDWLVVIIDYATKKGKVIVNDVEQLKKYYEMFKDDIWIGYNSRGYDQYILKGLLLGYDPSFINNKIILEGIKGHNIVRDAYKIKLNNFDLSNKFRSLKELEAFMGSRIKESSVPFDVDRKLTDQELNEVIDYCKHDVRMTIEVFENWTEEFESQLGLIEEFDLDMTMFNKTKAQLSAYILGAEKHEDRGDEFDFTFPETIKLDKYKYIMDWYKDPKNKRYEDDDGKKLQLKTEVAGVEHVFGFGGVHSAIPKYQAEGIILCCDVALT